MTRQRNTTRDVRALRAATPASAIALALLAQAAPAQTAPAARASAPSAATVEQTAVSPPVADAAADAAEIVVTGSRLANTGFSAPTPVTVVGEQRITALANTNLGDVLVKLPAFRNTTSPVTALAATGSGGNLGARYLDLRGLGANRTLVLVEGRRFVPSSILGAVDSNLIPALLVKRTEIVTGGASAAYGSDAVSGVVNILLDRELKGIKAQIQRGITEQGDGSSLLVSLAGGFEFAGGRGHLVAGGEYSNEKAVGGCYTRDWCAREYGLVQNPDFRTNGQAANFISPNVRAATLTAAGIVNGPGALRGLQFNPDGSLGSQRFQYGTFPDIQFMVGGGTYGSNWRLAVPYLRIPIQRYSLFSNLDYDLTDDIKAFVTASYGQSKAQNRGAAFFERALTIRTDNPYIPQALRAQIPAGTTSFTFGRYGDFTLDGRDLKPTNADGKAQSFRIATGLSGSLGGSWKWDAYYQYGRSDNRILVRNVKNIANFNLAIDVVQGPNGPICRSTLTNPTNGCQPLNLFGIGQFSEAARNYAFGTPRIEQHLTQHVGAVSVTGNLAELWAGPLSVATGLEFRQDITRADADAIGQAVGWQYNNGGRYHGKITTKEIFGEASLPLARDWSFAKLLDLNGAVRHTDYSTSGQVTTWKLGLVYEPVTGVRFRGTRSRDIRAPTAQELYNPGGATPGGVTDRTTNVNATVRVRTGGNPNLVPEVATTWTGGVVLTPGGPGWLRPLRLSVDWYDISIKGAVAALAAQQIVDRCFAGATDLCALITRGSDGIISEVRALQLNLNRLITRGVDAELDYRLPLGAGKSLDFNLLGSYVKDLITVDAVGPVDRAGQTGQQYLGALGVPKWNLTATTTLQLGKFSATVENRYIPRGKYDSTLIGPEDPGYSNTLATSIASNRIAARFYTNLGLRYLVRPGTRAEVEFYGAINNLFDRDPPPSPGNTGTNPTLFDTIGRSFQVGIRARY
ncbi:TonB-dependent receptor domain-containing protein [Sphingomonas sp. MMS24-J13]|uniref:TonB-dependent receptor domain-containing protein n=1 Tax=Sphingomonas sp. MMS24-J13 TaxID=3238686 RepID=UPI00384F0D7B